MSNKKHLEHEHSIKKAGQGFIILFVIVIFVIPFLLNKYAPFSVFVTYFANIDIIANILSINYPGHFHHFYDPFNQRTIAQYLSFNLISLLALSGIFMAGLHDPRMKKEERLAVMIIMSIITYTLPTQGLPFLNKKIDKYIESKGGEMIEKNKEEKVFITLILSLCFIVGEFLIIQFLLSLRKSIIGLKIVRALLVMTILGIGLFALKDEITI
jgi:hypothetical protein